MRGSVPTHWRASSLALCDGHGLRAGELFLLVEPESEVAGTHRLACEMESVIAGRSLVKMIDVAILGPHRDARLQSCVKRFCREVV